ncbi:hypothetical protein J3R83DRAFT_9938 [Lanmaoa asiatica]|nr:hypothetical protein J3R83DRAFT_9938 [Lanmaoa asiatica]
MHAKANGRMVYTVPLIIFMDDVSRNVSKQWNKYHVVYMSNTSLPCEMLEKEICVRFVTASPHAAPMELMKVMKESICRASESGIEAWDCKGKEEVLLIPYGLFVAGDNPMQAEECSHAGLQCNYFCQTCDVGGMKEHKESENGYNVIFLPGQARTPEKTAVEISRQIELALESGAGEKVKSATTSSGVRDSTTSAIVNALVELGKKLRKRKAGSATLTEVEVKVRLQKELENWLQGESLKDAINPLLGMKGMNIHMDTPTEVLHTVLLSVMKYFWGQTVFLLKKARLLDKDGLKMPYLNADYICHYKGSLIGKHFKSLAQVMPFLIYDLIPKSVLDGWTAIGELVVLIWHTTISNLRSYLAQLTKAINDFLNISATCAPSILISKPKFHFLVHLPAYIQQFGPAILFSTKRYESFNHVFRLACVYSNRLAPSRDVCKTFACLDLVKHITTSGFWFDAKSRKWVCGGSKVLDYLAEHSEQARLLGIPKETSEEAETARILLVDGPQRKKILSDPVLWHNTHCAKILNMVEDSGRYYYKGTSLVTTEHDILKLNTCAIFQDPCLTAEKRFRVGCIHEILIFTDGPCTAKHVAFQLFSFTPALHPALYLPCLELTNDDVVVPGNYVVCIVNIQHNCIDLKCMNMGTKSVWQERMETSRTTSVVNHKPSRNFFLNTYTLHNNVHLHALVPPNLWETPLHVPNIEQACKAAVQQLCVKRITKSGQTLDTNDAQVDDSHVNTDRPAFDRPTKGKTRGAGKGKEKVKNIQLSVTMTEAPTDSAQCPSSSRETPSVQTASAVPQNPATFSLQPILPMVPGQPPFPTCKFLSQWNTGNRPCTLNYPTCLPSQACIPPQTHSVSTQPTFFPPESSWDANTLHTLNFPMPLPLESQTIRVPPPMSCSVPTQPSFPPPESLWGAGTQLHTSNLNYLTPLPSHVHIQLPTHSVPTKPIYQRGIDPVVIQYGHQQSVQPNSQLHFYWHHNGPRQSQPSSALQREFGPIMTGSTHVPYKLSLNLHASGLQIYRDYCTEQHTMVPGYPPRHSPATFQGYFHVSDTYTSHNHG